jgi:hypothetical protein
MRELRGAEPTLVLVGVRGGRGSQEGEPNSLPVDGVSFGNQCFQSELCKRDFDQPLNSPYLDSLMRPVDEQRSVGAHKVGIRL